jgi:hypothetical protein
LTLPGVALSRQDDSQQWEKIMVLAKTIVGCDFVQEMVGTGCDTQTLSFAAVWDSVSLFAPPYAVVMQ